MKRLSGMLLVAVGAFALASGACTGQRGKDSGSAQADAGNKAGAGKGGGGKGGDKGGKKAAGGKKGGDVLGVDIEATRTKAMEESGVDMLDPKTATLEAPDTYKVKFDTTVGEFTVQVNTAWAPVGANRFYNLVKAGFYNDVAFFRAIDGFMVQFGINGSPQVTKAWKTAKIKDDEVKEKNTRGRITFATSGPDSRTTQVFINFNDKNVQLDGMGFAPFGEVIDGGMEVVDKIHKGYGEGAPRGMGPSQGKIERDGNPYLEKSFPKLDYVKTVTVIEG